MIFTREVQVPMDVSPWKIAICVSAENPVTLGLIFGDANRLTHSTEVSWDQFVRMMDELGFQPK